MEQKMWLETAVYQTYVQPQPASLPNNTGLGSAHLRLQGCGGEESSQPLFCLLDENADAERGFAALCRAVHPARWSCNCGVRAVVAERALFCCCG